MNTTEIDHGKAFFTIGAGPEVDLFGSDMTCLIQDPDPYRLIERPDRPGQRQFITGFTVTREQSGEGFDDRTVVKPDLDKITDLRFSPVIDQHTGSSHPAAVGIRVNLRSVEGRGTSQHLEPGLTRAISVLSACINRSAALPSTVFLGRSFGVGVNVGVRVMVGVSVLVAVGVGEGTVAVGVVVIVGVIVLNRPPPVGSYQLVGLWMGAL